MQTGGISRARRGVSAIVLTVGAMAGIGGPSAAGAIGRAATQADAAPAFTVTAAPSTGLVDGQVVSVTVSGANFAQLTECVGTTIDLASCDENSFVFTTTGAPTPFTVDTTFTANGQTVDCRTTTCSIVARGFDDQGNEIDASTPLSFDPNGPIAPPATITVAPTTGLRDGQHVTVRITGARANSTVQVMQCNAHPVSPFDDCDLNTEQFESAGADGSLLIDMPLAVDPSFGGVSADCRKAGACSIQVSAGRDTLLVPTVFDPRGPGAPTLKIKATPTKKVRDGQVVHVTGTGARPNRFFSLLQCANDGDVNDCSLDNGVFDTVDANGNVSGDLTLLARIRIDNGATTRVVDCRKAPGCVVRVTAAGHTATAKLSFDPKGPAGNIVVTLDGLKHGDWDLQTFSLSNGIAQSNISVNECRTGASDASQCRRIDDPIFGTQIDEDGRGGSGGRIAFTFSSASGPIDCRIAPGCEIVADLGGAREGRALLPIAANAALLGAPVLSAPTTTFTQDATFATVTGTSFPAQGFVTLKQCTTGPGRHCHDLGTTLGESTIDFRENVVVRSTIDDGSGVVDCRTTSCALVAHDDERDVDATLPLHFAPATSNGRYIDVITPNVGVQRNIAYASSTGRRMDVFTPAGDSATNRPVVVVFADGPAPNGGRASGEAIARAYAQRGYVAATVDYAANATDRLADARGAITYLKSNAVMFRIDPNAIVATGANDLGSSLARQLGRPADGGAAPIAATIDFSSIGSVSSKVGDPALLRFNYNGDPTACGNAAKVGVACSAVAVGRTAGIANGIDFDDAVVDTSVRWLDLHVLQRHLPCTMFGTDGNDTLTGTAGDDVICGLSGNDRINGNGGRDTIYGGPGDDIIDGGAANDTIDGGPGTDNVTGGSGTDTCVAYEKAKTCEN